MWRRINPVGAVAGADDLAEANHGEKMGEEGRWLDRLHQEVVGSGLKGAHLILERSASR